MLSKAAENYLQAAAAVSDIVARVNPDTWDGAGLGSWDLRSLVGHTSRALVTVLTYLHRPADHVDLVTPEDYFVSTLHGRQSVDEQTVVERGRQAGRDLGADPAAGFHALLQRVSEQIAEVDPHAVIATVGGGMTVEAYLPTRTFELVVHGLDIGAATDLPIVFTPTTLDAACELAGRIAARMGSGPLVLRALTGRTDLPRGFSVMG